MRIQATKKLLDELQIKKAHALAEPTLFSWHANVLTVGRRQAVVLVHDVTRYVIVLHGLKARDFSRLGQVAANAVRELWTAEGIDPATVEKFLQAAGEISWHKTFDRSSTARLNQLCQDMPYLLSQTETDTRQIPQRQLSLFISDAHAGLGSPDSFIPNQRLVEKLADWVGGPVLSGRAFQLKVTLEMTEPKVWRRLVVPGYFTFEQLHYVLQAAFGWHNCHLHEFNIFEGSAGHRPTLTIMDARSLAENQNERPAVPEATTGLAEHLRADLRLWYAYDFGDDWQHQIAVEKILDDYQANYAVCLKGVGQAPPEDVGGEPGYEEFLRVMADPADPEHEDTAAWAKSQGYERFDMEKINRRLKHSRWRLSTW